MKAAKIWIMGIMAVIAWIADWYFLNQIIYHSQTVGWFMAQFAATILGIIFLAFFLIINKNKLVTLVLDLIIFVGYLVIMPKDWYVALGGLIFFVLLFMFEQRLAAEEKSRLDFSLRRVLSGSVSVAIYALLLLVGFNVYHSVHADFRDNPDDYYRRLGRAAALTVPYFTKGLPGGVDFNQTFDQFASSQVGTDNSVATDIYKQEFLKQFAVTASGNETLSDIFAQVAVDKIKAASKGFEKYFPFLMAITVTALLWTFAFLVRWLAMLAGWVIFKVLLMTGFFKIEKVQVEVEKLMV